MECDESSTNSEIDSKRIKNEEAVSQETNEEPEEPPPSFSLATLGLQRVGTAPPPKPVPQQPVQMLNARGMPARIRKRNRFFFDDDIINDDKPLRMSLSPRKLPLKPTNQTSPTKTPTKVLKKRKGIVSRYMRSEEKNLSQQKQVTTPTKVVESPASASSSTTKTAKAKTSEGNVSATTSVVTADKKIGQRIGLRLRNLLKLPKAHKWVIFEWFYSFIDKPLFNGENDFQACLAETFPHLRTRKLTRAEWQKLRSLMGKPRRCSPAFFAEERREIEKKRQKIRFMQSRRSGEVKDLNFLRDLPEKIPLPLPVGTKVTARLRVPQDGIFSGTVDAFESMTSSYRVAFDRAGLGTHSIPDYEIVSESFHEMLPIQSITKDFRPTLMSMYIASQGKGNGNGEPYIRVYAPRQFRNTNNMNKSDPLLGQEVIDSPFKNPVLREDNINGYPPKLLETMVRLKRALKIKQSKLQRLHDMNNDAQLKVSQKLIATQSSGNASSSDESQMTNAEPAQAPPLSEEFQRRYASIVISFDNMNRDIQDYLSEVQALSAEMTRDPQSLAMLTPSHLREKCKEAAEAAVKRSNHDLLESKKTLNLIKNLATVLLVTSHLRTDNSAQVNKVLDGCIEEVRSSLYNANVETFQKHVQIHLHHIRLGIGQSIMNSSSNSNAAEEA